MEKSTASKGSRSLDSEFYQSHFELSPIPGVVLTPKGKCLLVNHAFINLFNLTVQEEDHSKIEFLELIQDQDQIVALLEEIWEKQVIRRREMELETRDGYRFTLLLSGRALLTGDEPSVELLLVDVTQQKRIEREFRHERSRRVSLLEALDVGLFQVGLDGEVTEVNNALVNLLQLGERSLIGKPFRDLFGILLSRSVEPEAVQHQLREAEIRVAEKPSIDIVLGDQPPQYLTVTFFPIWDEDGASLGWGGMIQDVTDVREHTLWKLDLISMLAHDIRAPLATLKGQATALLANYRGWSREMVEDFLEGINSSTDNLIHQVERNLAITRVESGSLGLRPEVTSVKAIIERALDRAEGILHGGQVRVTLPDSLPEVRVDPARIEEVLINLLENAARFSPPDRSITISASEEGNWIELTVSDQGEGVPSGMQEEIFEKHVTSDKDRGGVGLGLYISRRIIEAHGGRIWVGSTQDRGDQGARFHFTLPVMPDVSRQKPEKLPETIRFSSVPEEELKVLIVEDEPDYQVLLRTVLEEEGFQTEVVPDGQTALEIVQISPPDLILLDWMLPGMDGLNLCRNIRRWSNVPIIMVTSRTAQEDIVRALDAGADDYVSKPFRTPELLARIYSAARRRATWAEAEPDRLSVDGLTINFDSQEVWLSGQRLELTPTELNLLMYLARNRGQVLTYELIMEHLYGEEKDASLHNIFVHVSRLRKKIEPDPDEPRFILTRWGTGYMFAA